MIKDTTINQFVITAKNLSFSQFSGTLLRKEISIFYDLKNQTPTSNRNDVIKHFFFFIYFVFFCQISDNKKNLSPTQKKMKLYKKWFIFPLFIYRIVFFKWHLCLYFVRTKKQHNAPRIISARNFCFITNTKIIYLFLILK